MVQIIRHPKNEPGTQTEPFKPIWLTLRTMVNWIPDRGLFVATLGSLHIAINYPHFLAQWVVQHIERHSLECFSRQYDPKYVENAHYNNNSITTNSFLEEVVLLS